MGSERHYAWIAKKAQEVRFTEIKHFIYIYMYIFRYQSVFVIVSKYVEYNLTIKGVKRLLENWHCTVNPPSVPFVSPATRGSQPKVLFKSLDAGINTHLAVTKRVSRSREMGHANKTVCSTSTRFKRGTRQKKN